MQWNYHLFVWYFPPGVAIQRYIQRCLKKNAQDGWGPLSRKGQFEGCGRVKLICQIATNVAFLFKERFAEVLK